VPMTGLNRRTFFGVSVGGLSALHGQSAALAALPAGVFSQPSRAYVEQANTLNLRLFLQNKDTLGLTGLLSMKPVEGELGSYGRDTLILFPFKHRASGADLQAFLSGRSAAEPVVATVAMTPGGLSPDEYFCNYVLKAPRQSFISFSIGAPFVCGAQKRAWHTNVDNIGGGSIGIGWTSSNLNHPWFAGSRWIPDRGDGKYWRARIIEGVRQVSAAQMLAFGGLSGAVR
jgi:hypothetical protein